MLSRRLLVFALGLAACAGTPRRESAASAALESTPEPTGGAAVAEETPPAEAPAEASRDPAQPERPKTLRPAQVAAAELAPSYLGVIDRAGLCAIIDLGLGHVLARLKLSPVLVQGKFQGFRVNAIDPAWAEAGLVVNDVVLRLNGRPIERPEQAMVAFDSLRVASELALELSRDGQKIALRYRIEGNAPTSSASAPR